MRIVDRKTFLSMPNGTIYAKIPRPIFVDGGMSVKIDMRGENDWWCNDLANWDSQDSGEWAARYEEMVAAGVSYPIDRAATSDGLFDEGDMFLIYERADLEWIRDQINAAILTGGNQDVS